MQRTTINVKPNTLQILNKLAEEENRPLSNLIETIIMRYLAEAFFVDEFEMNEIQQDVKLNKSIKSAMSDYKAGRGKFIS